MDMTATTNSTNTGLTTPTTTIGANTGGFSIIQPIKSPEAESETSPRIRPTKPTSFTNGVLKRHKQQHTVVGGVAYKECLKNHAASLGGHALDGCGEFMPAPNATAIDPTSLKCAACGCHRNFHRREMEEISGGGGGGGATTHVIEYHPHHRHHPLPPPGAHLSAPPQAVAPCRVQSPGSDNNSPPPISSTYYPGSAPHMLLALSSGGGTPDDTDNKNPAAITTTATNNNNNGNIEYHHQNLFGTSPHMPSRKRFRTKFSQEQKDRMYEFAEKVGWKMQKSNEDLVNGFCNEIGVERGVFKVWMHNNKNTLGKRSGASAAANNYGISANNQGGISIENINDPLEEDEEHDGIINGNGVGNNHSSSINNNHHHQHQQYNGHGRGIESNAVPANASSCSS